MRAERTGGLEVAEDREVVHVSLEIESASDPIAGVIRRSGEPAEPFVGWLALSAGLERLRRVEKRRGPAVPDTRIARFQLTTTEREIVALVCEGLTNREIAQRLYVSPRTVQGRLLKVFKKLGVSSRTQLAAQALRAELTKEPIGGGQERSTEEENS